MAIQSFQDKIWIAALRARNDGAPNFKVIRVYFFALSQNSNAVKLGYLMDAEEIQKMIESNVPDSKVVVQGDGRHFEAQIISATFEGLNLLARQRVVYSALGDNIRNGNIHALSIKAKTPQEWEIENKKIHG